MKTSKVSDAAKAVVLVSYRYILTNYPSNLAAYDNKHYLTGSVGRESGST